MHLKYSKLGQSTYFTALKPKYARVIFKARTRMYDIKTGGMKTCQKIPSPLPLNVIGGLFMQLRYTWLDSFVSKNLQWSTIRESQKLIGSSLKRLNKNEMNGIERLHIQLSYSWLNSLVRKKIREVQWTRTILKFPYHASYISLRR